MELTLNDLREKGLIVYECYRGSFAYGTFIEGVSDIDTGGVYVLPLDMLLAGEYQAQVGDKKNDTVFYELGRFIELLGKANPSILELLYTNEDCIITKHPIMDEIFQNKEKFITKVCKDSFGGYVKEQLVKASGLDKKVNKSMEELTTRKNVLDFIYTPFEQGSQHFTTWLENRGLEQAYCGLVSIPNMRYMYAVYYDFVRYFYNKQMSFLDENLTKPFNFWLEVNGWDGHTRYTTYSHILMGKHEPAMYNGVVRDVEISNDISLSSVSKGEVPLCYVQFNKDGYSQHCKKFHQDQEWLKKRNVARYVAVQSHGQTTEDGKMIDGKNMLHCMRGLRMMHELVEGKGLIIKRPDFEYLIEIRQGKHDLNSLMDECIATLAVTDELFENSDLPDGVDVEFSRELLKKLRKEYYNV